MNAVHRCPGEGSQPEVVQTDGRQLAGKFALQELPTRLHSHEEKELRAEDTKHNVLVNGV